MIQELGSTESSQDVLAEEVGRRAIACRGPAGEVDGGAVGDAPVGEFGSGDRDSTVDVNSRIAGRVLNRKQAIGKLLQFPSLSDKSGKDALVEEMAESRPETFQIGGVGMFPKCC